MNDLLAEVGELNHLKLTCKGMLFNIGTKPLPTTPSTTMPPKKGAKTDHKQANAATQDLEGAEHDPLQAVILADSFNRRFDVLCVDKPRVGEVEEGDENLAHAFVSIF